MKLNPIKANMTEVEYADKLVLFSYKTPVAAKINRTYYKTSQKWSNTTTRHVNQWLNGAETELKPQSFFDELV